MRKRFLTFILLLDLTFFSCKSNKTNSCSLELISIRIPLSNIFSQNFYSYYALVYSSTCMACINTIEVLEYKMKKQKINIYLIDFNEVKNKDCISNIGVDDYNLINVIRVPLLFKIENRTIIDEIYGFENIRNYDLYSI